MGAGFVFYCVVDAEGRPRKRRNQSTGTFMIYDELGVAKRQCRIGDAVCEMTLDLGREPLFIKARKDESDGE